MSTKLIKHAHDTAFTYALKGIPCTIALRNISFTEPVSARQAHSDVEAYGELMFEWAVFDRKGYAAPWLERKVNDADLSEFSQYAVDWWKDQGLTAPGGNDD